MNDNVRKVFDMLGVEPGEIFKVENNGFSTNLIIDKDLIIISENGRICSQFLSYLLNGTYRIIKLPKKKKLRDLTPEEWDKWREKNCNNCDKCIFRYVMCGSYRESWIHNKDLYSDKFLDQEIEVEE